jgi:hypothetical protein
MKNGLLKRYGKVLVFLLFINFPLSVMAGVLPAVGSTLTETELAKLSITGTVQVGQNQYRILGVNAGTLSKPSTLVVNAQGVVGLSNNEVVVTNAATSQVKTKVGTYSGKTLAVNYFDSMNMTALQFQSFRDAVNARNELQTLFPQATVTLPITFSIRNYR